MWSGTMMCATDACIAFSVDAILIDDEVCTILDCANNHQLCTFRESLNVFHPWNGLFLSRALRGPSKWDTCEHEPDVVGVFLFFSVNEHVCDDAISLCFHITIYSLVMSYCKDNSTLNKCLQENGPLRTWNCYISTNIIFNYLFIWNS